MENDSPFRIAATEGIREPRTRILKHGDTSSRARRRHHRQRRRGIGLRQQD
jgi:hypothetical protein